MKRKKEDSPSNVNIKGCRIRVAINPTCGTRANYSRESKLLSILLLRLLASVVFLSIASIGISIVADVKNERKERKRTWTIIDNEYFDLDRAEIGEVAGK